MHFLYISYFKTFNSSHHSWDLPLNSKDLTYLQHIGFTRNTKKDLDPIICMGRMRPKEEKWLAKDLEPDLGQNLQDICWVELNIFPVIKAPCLTSANKWLSFTLENKQAPNWHHSSFSLNLEHVYFYKSYLIAWNICLSNKHNDQWAALRPLSNL